MINLLAGLVYAIAMEPKKIDRSRYPTEDQYIRTLPSGLSVYSGGQGGYVDRLGRTIPFSLVEED